jgi:hypothetical protein
MAYGGLNKKHTFFIYDVGGLFSQFAISLSNEGHEVYYFTPFYESVTFKRYAIGLNMGNVKKPLYFFQKLLKFKKEDVTIMFPDVGAGDLAHFLKQMGYSVFAAGLGDIMEFHREWVKKKLKELELPVMKYALVEGIENLKKYLEKNPDKIIKLDIFRGDAETWHAQDANSVDMKLKKLEKSFGPFAYDYNFIVEEKIEGDEPGFDMIFNKTEYVKPYLWGWEIKKGPYCGVCSLEVPKVIAQVRDGLKPLLQKLDWRGFISTEMKVRDGKPYLIDICARAPHPLGLGFPLLYENFAEIIYKVARGIPVEAKIRGKFFVVLPVGNPVANEEWVHLIFPEKAQNGIKIGDCYFAIYPTAGARSLKYQKGYYHVPNVTEYTFVIVGVGNDLKKIKKGISYLQKKVDIGGEGIETMPEADLNEAFSHIQRVIKEQKIKV